MCIVVYPGQTSETTGAKHWPRAWIHSSFVGVSARYIQKAVFKVLNLQDFHLHSFEALPFVLQGTIPEILVGAD